jgi:molybdate transport system substrate-binding protein
VKAGAAKPDISSADAVRRTLIAAKTIAYSDSASGAYVGTEMFAKLGIAEEMKGKARKIPAAPVGEIVARGDAEIGFQQVIATVSTEPEAGRALIEFLASPAASDTIVKSGMEPITDTNY